MPDYYDVLQVAPAADPEVIEAAYRRLARKWHPDTNTSAEAPTRIRDLNEAYEVLSDPARRRQYDATRVVGRIGARAAGTNPLVLAAAAIGGLLLVGRFGRAALPLLVLGGVYWWFRVGRR